MPIPNPSTTRPHNQAPNAPARPKHACRRPGRASPTQAKLKQTQTNSKSTAFLMPFWTFLVGLSWNEKHRSLLASVAQAPSTPLPLHSRLRSTGIQPTKTHTTPVELRFRSGSRSVPVASAHPGQTVSQLGTTAAQRRKRPARQRQKQRTITGHRCINAERPGDNPPGRSHSFPRAVL